ncbi:MAG: MFS transporter [Cyclobacteriaceae bacterium]
MNPSKFARIPFDPSKWPFFYGWIVIGLGTLGILVSIPGQTIGVSTFTDSLIDVLSINRDQISLAYMVGTVLSSFFLTKAGKFYDKYGVRAVAGIGSFGLGLSLIILSQVNKMIDWLGIAGQNIPIIIVMIFGFSSIRFFGQGVLTLASRTMMMKWFDAKRGFATSFSNVFTALGFSAAPLYIELLIREYNWDGAWMTMGLIAAFVFPFVVFIFFRNSPSDVGLIPDGKKVINKDKKKSFQVFKEFTLAEARSKIIFWVFAGFLGMQALYVTGFTFHVVSIFDTAGMDRSVAISIFQPIAIVSVVASLVFGWISDHLKLNILLYSKGGAALISLTGLMFLGKYDIAYYMIIVGSGLMNGLFGVINTVSWPRLFGKLHLGAIGGFCMTIMVFGSAIGPMMFSLSLSQSGDYTDAAIVVLAVFMTLTALATRVKNPQAALGQSNSKTE